jgi:hypothetical protein
MFDNFLGAMSQQDFKSQNLRKILAFLSSSSHVTRIDEVTLSHSSIKCEHCGVHGVHGAWNQVALGYTRHAPAVFQGNAWVAGVDMGG